MKIHSRAVPRTVLAMLTVGAAALFVAACGGSDSGSSDTGASSADVKGKKVILVTCEPNVFCNAYNVNLTKNLEAKGVQVKQLSDNFDPALQNQHMNQAIAQKPDAIVLFASNADAVVPSLKRAKAANVPVINVNARLKPAAEALITAEIVADNAALGKSAAENIVEGMKKAGYDKGNIMAVTGTAGTLIVQDRIDAWNAYMKDYPQYKTVAVEDGNWDQVASAKLASQVFAKYRNKGGIQGAWGMADYQAAGIIQAADQAGIKTGVENGDVVVTASNCTPTGIPLMASGKLWGNATQSPIEESDKASEVVTEFLAGEDIPKTTTVEEERFTMENYKDFEALCADWPSSK